METKITLEDVTQRLAALEKAVADLTAEKKPQAAGISFEHIGGKKVGHHVPVKGAKEIRFEHIGGRCIRRSPLWANGEQPTAEKEDDARE